MNWALLWAKISKLEQNSGGGSSADLLDLVEYGATMDTLMGMSATGSASLAITEEQAQALSDAIASSNFGGFFCNVEGMGMHVSMRFNTLVVVNKAQVMCIGLDMATTQNLDIWLVYVDGTNLSLTRQASFVPTA